MPAITVALEKSLNHILAEDIVATYDIPRFDKSPYDGFAIRSVDSRAALGTVAINFEIKLIQVGAGSVSDKLVGDHEAVEYYDWSTNT